MSSIRVRRYETNGRGFIRAEIEWVPGPTQSASVVERFNLPNGEIASLTVDQRPTFLDLTIYPEDVQPADHLRLPVISGQPLPSKLVGCAIPSLYFALPYLVTPLDDNPCGFALQAGIRPAPGAPDTARIQGPSARKGPAQTGPVKPRRKRHR